MITYVLFGIIILQQIIHCFERRDLYSRIMSKSLTEYKDKKSPFKSAHSRVLNKWRGKEAK